jgi:hypothetical protein
MALAPPNAEALGRRWRVVVKPANVIVLATCVALQPLMLFLFDRYGHDNQTYLRFFDVLDEGPSYLEPLWLGYAAAMSWLGLDSAESLLAGMACVMSVLIVYLLYKVQAGVKHPVRVALLLALLLSYQVSALGGALRQGVSFFLVCIFLVTSRTPALLLSAGAHWSGIFYLPLLFRRATTAIVFAVLAAASLAYFLFQSQVDIGFVGQLLIRLEGYTDIDSTAETGRLLGVMLAKASLGAVFLGNRTTILAATNRQVGILILAAPFLQLSLALSNNMVLVDRGGMILDPFVLVGMVVLIKRSSSWSLALISALILQKLATRILFLFITAP